MKKKSKIKPFQNESQVLEIGDLTVENRTDRVSIHGSLDITRDKEGKLKADTLKALLDDIALLLESEELPEKIEDAPAKTVKNPLE